MRVFMFSDREDWHKEVDETVKTELSVLAGKTPKECLRHAGSELNVRCDHDELGEVWWDVYICILGGKKAQTVRE